jgi:hypothetical protein
MAPVCLGGEDYDEIGVVSERWESAVGLDADPDNIAHRPGRDGLRA